MLTSTRQLAAIMFTDIVGYTALMGKDSNKALEQVRQSKDIQKPLVEKFNGKWLKEMGDGAMAQFNTALDAVNCAIEIQRASRADFEGDIRIGIHLGDITIENNDVYGDGVNIASRLESIADPGGIYISDAIEKAIRGQLSLQAKYLGEVNLKNVDYGVRSYALQGVGLPVPDIKDEKQLRGHFWAEVQRRGIIRAGITYILAGLVFIFLWNLGQSWIEMPQWSYALLTTILGIGFPVAMFLAWNYERSPEGFVKTISQKSWQNPYSGARRKPLTSNLTIAVLVVITALLFFYRPNQDQEAGREVRANAEIVINDKSIAVLPFVNMSNDPNQDYFSDGMMEEILNHLYKIGDLLVTSRTSAMRYKGSTKSIPEIAKELGVSTILEGSVRKSGNQVRITVQLIDGNTDKHLWSETFDRSLDDIFAIQSEVAQSIASTLQAEIQPEVRLRIESQPTSNTDAYNLFLETNGLNPFDESENKQALRMLEEVIRLDPTFGRAYASVGFRLQTGATFFAAEGGADPIKTWIISKPYLEKALVLDPENGNIHVRMAWSLLWFEWDFKAAAREYEKAKEILPNYSWTDYLVATGNYDEAATGAERSVEIDQSDAISWSSLITAQYYAGKHQEVIQNIQAAIKDSLQRQNILTLTESSRVYMYLGKYEEVRAIVKLINENWPDLESPRILAIQAISEYHLGNQLKVSDIIKKLQDRSEDNAGGSPSFFLGMIYSEMGETGLAFKWLEKGYQEHEVEMYWLKVEPPFAPLRKDPRWQLMLDKVGFPAD